MRRGAAEPVLRVAVAGTGMIGRIHARSARLAGARLVGVAASTTERSIAAAGELGAERAGTAVELATADDVDVLHVCTPNDTHAELAITALEHGKHVVLEKPVGVSLDEAHAIADAARDSGAIVGVPFVYRYHPTARHAREMVAAGELGDVHLIHGSYLQDWLLDPTATNWRVDIVRGGPSRAFADIGSHWCDLAAFVTGECFERVTGSLHTATSDRREPDGAAARTEDSATVLLRTSRGVPASVVVSQASPGRKNRLWLEVDGTRASVVFDQEQPERLWVGREGGSSLVDRDPGHLAGPAARLAVLPPGHPQGYLDCFELFVRDVYTGIRDGAVPEGTPTLSDGVHAAAITDAVLRSAVDGGQWSDLADPVPASTTNGTHA